ncbi:MAG: glycosyltransferase family 2 protein [Verrucomicrobiota bacterium]|nr:glycosyltransferase family 2 protein [Verrucomicrobiota bacterium]
MTTFVIIPARNEAPTLAQVLREVRQHVQDIIVVDDFSSDRTAEIANKEKAFVVSFTQRMGKGIAVREGIAIALKRGADRVILLDGDGQHDPAMIPAFIKESDIRPSDQIVGNRFHAASSIPWVRRITNKIMSWHLEQMTGLKLKDSQCGFRLLPARFLRKCRLETRNFEIESELLMESARLGVGISFVNIPVIYGGEKSKINVFMDTWRWLKFICRSKEGPRLPEDRQPAHDVSRNAKSGGNREQESFFLH